MKKLSGVLAISSLVLAVLLAYSSWINEHPEKRSTYMAEMATVTPVPTITVSGEGELPMVVEEVTALWEEEETKRSAYITQAVEMPVFEEDNYLFAYKQLDSAGQDVYDAMYKAIIMYSEDVMLPTVDTGLVSKAFKCIMNDHPEIFYVDGYKIVKHTLGKTIKEITFTADYVYPRNERDSIWRKLDDAAEKIVNNAPKGTDYQKIKYVYDTIVNNTDYVANAPDNQNIISVFLNHESVCSGYAKATQLLLNRIGIPATLVVGSVASGDAHAWNLVYADDAWYYLDATWGDAFYILADHPLSASSNSAVNYDYFLVTTAELRLTHNIDNIVKLPSCKAVENNYYIREGLFFDTYDEAKLKEVFGRAYDAGMETITFKCVNGDVYDEMIDNLMNKQKVFDYLDGGTNETRYGHNEQLHTLTFWL